MQKEKVKLLSLASSAVFYESESKIAPSMNVLKRVVRLRIFMNMFFEIAKDEKHESKEEKEVRDKVLNEFTELETWFCNMIEHEDKEKSPHALLRSIVSKDDDGDFTDGDRKDVGLPAKNKDGTKAKPIPVDGGEDDDRD